MRLLPIALGLPGTIGFPTAIAHHRSPHRQVTEVSYAGKNIIAYHPSHGNAAPTSRMDCFVDSLLVAWQSSIDRLIRIAFPSRNAWWFEEKEIPHGQISCHPHR